MSCTKTPYKFCISSILTFLQSNTAEGICLLFLFFYLGGGSGFALNLWIASAAVVTFAANCFKFLYIHLLISDDSLYVLKIIGKEYALLPMTFLFNPLNERCLVGTVIACILIKFQCCSFL